MIYTVTCNPAMDYTLTADTLRPGALNRPRHAALFAGGKGVNVSRILHLLGTPHVSLGFVAGEVGTLFTAAVAREGLTGEWIPLSDGETRINVKICADEETEINAPGPAVDAAAWERLVQRLSALGEGDILCLCGSVPASLGGDAYRRLLCSVAGHGVRTVVDADGALLLYALEAHPWLIKPNRVELERLVGHPLADEGAVIAAAEELHAGGVANVLVSLGGEGALLCCEAGVFRCAAPAGEVQAGTVSAGDSALAGFLAACDAGAEAPDALRQAVACGSAAAFCSGRLQDRGPVDRLLQATAIEKLRK